MVDRTLNVAKCLTDNDFDLRSDHDGGYYYGKGEYDGYGELIVGYEGNGKWMWFESLPDMPDIPVVGGEIVVNGIEYGDAEKFFEEMVAQDELIEAWVKSIVSTYIPD